MHDVMKGIGLDRLSERNKSAEARISKILRSLGWEPGDKEAIDGERVRRWHHVKIMG
jgi:hypothetical protein